MIDNDQQHRIISERLRSQQERACVPEHVSRAAGCDSGSLQMLGLRRLSLISDVHDLTSATPPPLRPEEILTTLQTAPRQRGWRLTVVAFPSLLTWYLQKTLNCVLTRLSCCCFADTVYFHLPPLSGDMKCVYGVSCYRQIEAKVSQRCFFFFFFWFVPFL